MKNGAQLLDRLIKDVVTESSVSTHTGAVAPRIRRCLWARAPSSDVPPLCAQNFDSDRFIPLLKERIKIRNVHVRQLVVSWIAVLDSVPELDMLEVRCAAARRARAPLSRHLQRLLRRAVPAGVSRRHLRDAVRYGEGHSSAGRCPPLLWPHLSVIALLPTTRLRAAQASALLRQLLAEIVRSGDDTDLRPMVCTWRPSAAP